MQCQQAIETALLHRQRDIIRPPRRRRSRPRRVCLQVDDVEAHRLHQRLGAGELGVGLAAEADDDVGAQRQGRHGGDGTLDDAAVVGHGVEAAHAPQQRVVARLHREVQLLAGGGKIADRLEELWRGIARM